MQEAVLNYATYRGSNYRWMLGRFIVAAARLDEFYETASAFAPRNGADPWRVSVVVSGDVVDTLNQIKEFNAASGPGIVCDTAEIKAETAGIIENAAASIGEDITAYFEVPLSDALPDLITTIAFNRQRAKMRTGGTMVDAFPSSAAVIRFVKTCLAANVPFKATAGLHHAIRCYSPLTYEADAPHGTMHGFLNLFMMTGFARQGYKNAMLEEILEEEFEEVFHFEDQTAFWREDNRLTLPQIQVLRRTGIQAFGSCSFDEPVADLQKLGIL